MFLSTPKVSEEMKMVPEVPRLMLHLPFPTVPVVTGSGDDYAVFRKPYVCLDGTDYLIALEEPRHLRNPDGTHVQHLP